MLPIVLAAWIPEAISLDWALRAMQNMGTVAFWRLAGQVVYGALAPLLIGAGLAGVRTYAWLNVVGASVTAIGITVMLLRRHGLPKFSMDRRNLGRLGRRYWQGGLVGLSLAIVMVYYQADSLVLGYMKGTEAVGIFGVAYKIPFNLVVVGSLWLQAAYPHASATIVSDPHRFVRQLARAASVAAAVALAVGTGASMLAPQIMVGLFGEAYRAAATPFLLLTWSAAIALVQIHFSNAVLAIGADVRYLMGTVCAAVLNIALDLLLIPSMGPSGAAIATIAAEAFVMLYMLRRVTVRLGTPHFEWGRIARGALAAAVLGAALVPLREVFSLWPCLLIGALIYIAAAAGLGVLRLDELRALRRGGGNDSGAAIA